MRGIYGDYPSKCQVILESVRQNLYNILIELAPLENVFYLADFSAKEDIHPSLVSVCVQIEAKVCYGGIVW